MVRLTIFGALMSMKNQRVPLKQNPYITLPKPQARVFERAFMQQIPRSAQVQMGSLKRLLRATVTVYYPSMRSDLDCAHLYDLLQKAGVVRNDRYIREKHEVARVDKDNPRVEIQIEEL